MKKIFAVAALALGSVAFVGCASKHEAGVKSNLKSQWTDVTALPPAVTDAAKAVLEEKGLKDVTASSTAVDGMAKGFKADKTEITVNVVKIEKQDASTVTVKVGLLGDPALGAEIAAAVKAKAEMTPKP